jgi:hypothetical protein
VIEANLSTVQMRQPTPVSFSRKETGAETTAAALAEQHIAAIVTVTIGVTNPDVTCVSKSNKVKSASPPRRTA